MIMPKSFSITFRFVPPLLLVFGILTALKGHYNPIADAENILSKYDNSISLLVGFESKGQLSLSETYLIINTKNLASITATIRLDNGEYIVTEKPGGLVACVAWYIILLGQIWWVWIRAAAQKDKASVED